MLPEAKLDILLAHHASLEAELLGQVNSEKYVQITRELAELNPLIEGVKAYRAARAEISDTESLIADPSVDPEMRSMAEAELETLHARVAELEDEGRKNRDRVTRLYARLKAEERAREQARKAVTVAGQLLAETPSAAPLETAEPEPGTDEPAAA